MFFSRKKFLLILPVAFGPTIEMFWENLISAPPGIILCPGRRPTSSISCWTWLHGEEHVGITGDRTEWVQSGCSSLLPVRSSAKVGVCIWTPCTSALLTGNLIVVSFAVFWGTFGWLVFLCPPFTVLSPLTYGIFTFVLLLDGPATQPALTHLRLKQLPRQGIRRTVHICFNTGMK